MFTFIENLQNTFSMCFTLNVGERLTPAVDRDGDGDLDMIDIRGFSPETQAAIRRVLGDTNMRTLEEGSRFSMESLIRHGFVVERNGQIEETRAAQRGLWETVDANLFPRGLAETFTGRLARGSQGPEVALLQRLLTERGFDARYRGVYDGDFGRGTETALRNYQRQVLGQSGDGVMDLNGSTMRSLLSDRPAGTQGASPEGVGTVNVRSRNAVERFFGIGRRDELRAQLDRYIGAGSTPELIELGNQAGRAKDGTPQEIEAVYNRIMEILPHYISDREVVNAFQIDFWDGLTRSDRAFAQSQVLDFFENALMGSAATERVARWVTGAEQYLIHNDRVLNESLGVMNGFDFVNTARSNMLGLRRHATGNLESVALGEGVYFSTRTQSGQARLGKFTTAQEATVINGAHAWEINETPADIDRFIEQMTRAQLTVINRQVEHAHITSKEGLRRLIRSWDVQLDAYMYLAENCSNLSFGLRVIDNTEAQDNWGGGWDNWGGGWVGTSPGVEGGWDEGGWGTGGWNDGGRG